MWSIATAAGSVGTTLGGPMLLYFIVEGNWRGAFLFAGIVSLLTSVVLYLFLTDKPITDVLGPQKTPNNSSKKQEPKKDTLSSFFQIVLRRFVRIFRNKFFFLV
jgi:sugar phosphate permease